MNICKLITSLIIVKSPINNEICKFLLLWMKRNSQIDQCVAIGALSDALLYDAISDEMFENIVTSVAETVENATDPGMQENIIHLFNICVINQPDLIQSIMSLMKYFIKWWEVSNEIQSGYQEVIDNLCSLFLALAISVSAFPQDLLCQVFRHLPQNDNENLQPMYYNIILFAQKPNITVELQKEIALSLCRLFMFDKKKIQAFIESDLLNDLQNLLLQILKNNKQFIPEIQKLCKKSKAKAIRINNVLSKL